MTLIRLLRAGLLTVPFWVGGCGPSDQTAHSQDRETRRQDNAARERAFLFSGGERLAERATFDLGCPRNMMEAHVIQRAGMFQVATSVGVRGCGRQAIFIRSYGETWILNSPVTQDPTAGPPPPMPPPPPPQQ